MAACYGVADCVSMSQARFEVWCTKTGAGSTMAPQLEILPPTTESFFQNVKLAHFQTSVWLAAGHEDPPAVCVEEFGWAKNLGDQSLSLLGSL